MTYAILKCGDTVAVMYLSDKAIADNGSKEKAVKVEVEKAQSRNQLMGAELVGFDIPLPGRELRNAWCWKTNKPEIDIDAHKATELTKQRLRDERAPKLAELDVEYMRALESGDKNKLEEITTRKNALRDITKKVPVCKSDVADEDFIQSLSTITVENV